MQIIYRLSQRKYQSVAGCPLVSVTLSSNCVHNIGFLLEINFANIVGRKYVTYMYHVLAFQSMTLKTIISSLSIGMATHITVTS